MASPVSIQQPPVHTELLNSIELMTSCKITILATNNLLREDGATTRDIIHFANALLRRGNDAVIKYKAVKPLAFYSVKPLSSDNDCVRQIRGQTIMLLDSADTLCQELCLAIDELQRVTPPIREAASSA